MRCIIGFFLAFVAQNIYSAPSLHTEAVSQGSLSVKLHPTQIVTSDTPELITFGVPFPRGSLAVDDLNRVKVIHNGESIPANVSQLSPWRHFSNPALDERSVRVARIQIQVPVTARYPAFESINLEWGGNLREENLPERPVREGWVGVSDGVTATGGPTFTAAQNVAEPRVYAVLPRQWLSAAGLKSPMAPMSAQVTMQRMDPTTVPTSYADYIEADQAQINFFYTVINEDDPNSQETDNNTNPFAQSAFEPWLYDRAMTFYIGYLRSGDFRMLREAVRNTDYYRQQLYRAEECGGNSFCVGSFKLKNPNPNGYHDEKYSYNESLALSYWLTGDDLALPSIEDVVNAQKGVPTAFGSNTFTERKPAFKLLANVVAYEITGNDDYRNLALEILDDFREYQTTTQPQVPLDGGLWHTIRSHEGVDNDTLITSPWMSALIVDAAMRMQMVSDESEVVELIGGLASHVCGLGSYLTSIREGENGLAEQSGGAVLRFPHYLATADGLGWDGEFNPFSNYEHSPDSAAIAAWGAYYSAVAGDQAEAQRLSECADELYTTFSHTITYWTRPTAPMVAPGFDAYRVRPARKYNWWFNNSSGFSWAMAAAAEGDQTPSNEAPVVMMTGPENGTTFRPTQSITITADATDSDGTVTRVEFFANDVSVGVDEVEPYQTEWQSISEGQFSLWARATDELGAMADAAAVTVTMEATSEAPVVSLIRPTDGVTLTSGDDVVVGVNASDPDGEIEKVELFVNGTLRATDTADPYSLILVDPPVGSHELFVRATDNDGNTADTETISITVNAFSPPPEPPSSGGGGGGHFGLLLMIVIALRTAWRAGIEAGE